MKLFDTFGGICSGEIKITFSPVYHLQKITYAKRQLWLEPSGRKGELPKPAKRNENKMTLFSSLHRKSDNYILTIYQSKPKIKVLLLNTKHAFAKVENNYKCIPKTITFYSKTKLEVDVVDQIAHKHNVKAGSCRWPLQVFFNILDLAVINA